MKKIGIILSLLLILFGFIGFISGALITMGVINYEKELPLGDIKGIVVDNKGHIYLGLGFYGKVQVYDTEGEFIKNWKVDASGGTFNIELTEDQDILISTARGNKQLLYDQKGKVLSKNSIDNIYSETKGRWDRFTTIEGETYEIKGGMFPKVIRSSTSSKLIVKQGLILQLMKGPFPAWLIAALGMGLNFLLRKDKIKEQMKKYKAHNRVDG
jgi:hypothetical protein